MEKRVKFEFEVIAGRIEQVVANNLASFINRLAEYSNDLVLKGHLPEEADDLAIEKLEYELYECVGANPGAYVRGNLYGGLLAPIAEELIHIREDGLNELWAAQRDYENLKRGCSKNCTPNWELGAQWRKAYVVVLNRLIHAEELNVGGAQALIECFRNYDGPVSMANAIRAIDGVQGQHNEDDEDSYVIHHKGSEVETEDEDIETKYISFNSLKSKLEEQLNELHQYDVEGRKLIKGHIDDIDNFVKKYSNDEGAAAKDAALRVLHSFDDKTTVDKEALKKALEAAAEFKDSAEKSEAQETVKAMRERLIPHAEVKVSIRIPDTTPVGKPVVGNSVIPNSVAKLYKKQVKKAKPVKVEKKPTEVITASEWKEISNEARAISKASQAREAERLNKAVETARNELDAAEIYGMSPEDIHRARRKLSEARAQLLKFNERSAAYSC